MPARERRIEISQDLLLLVEGRDESHLFGKLIEACFNDNRTQIQVMDIGGKTTLGRRLRAVHADALYKAHGISSPRRLPTCVNSFTTSPRDEQDPTRKFDL